MYPFRILIAAVIVSTAAPTAIVLAQDAAPDPATRPPADIMADVARDFATVKSFRLAGTSADDGGTTRLTADVDARRGERLNIRQGTFEVTLLELPSVTYVKGSATYWAAARLGRRTVARLAGRWVRLGAPSAKARAELRRELDMARMARCLTETHGTLANAGARMLGADPAVVIVDQGDQPGTTPGELWVSSTGRALPLRFRQTGRRNAGAVDTDCADTRDTTRSGDVRFSRYDEPVALNAPVHALDLKDAVASTGASSH